MSVEKLIEMHGWRGWLRAARCKASHGSVFTDYAEHQEGQVTVRTVVARWCGDCGRPLPEGERRHD